MAYLAPVHQPTSVKHALKIELITQDEPSLVVAKANKLEIYNQTPDGLVLFYSRSLYGKVTMLDKIRPSNSRLDHLFVGTDRYLYFTVSWDGEQNQLRTETSCVDQADRSLRDSQNQDRCQVDPNQNFLALLLFDGVVTILPLSHNLKRKASPEYQSVGDPVPARISDLFVRSFAFLHARPKDRQQHKLAFLYEDNHQKVCLSGRALIYSPEMNGEPATADLEKVLFHHDDIELGASHLIPVPAPAYGALILCEAVIYYSNDMQDDFVTKDLDQPVQFVAWTAIDNQRWLLADDFGTLYLLMLLINSKDEVEDWNLHAIGKTPQASVLVYLDDGYLFVGSHQGDSQVVKIQEQGLESVQTISNIAPVLDFTIMDMGNRSGEGQANEYSSGQARIVTGSGAFQDGSLRSVRSGVGLEEQGILGEMSHATDIFALKLSSQNNFDDVLVVSFVGETRVFQFQEDGAVLEQTDFKGFALSETTILASMTDNGRLLQVTGSAARLTDAESGVVIANFAPEESQQITAASANKTTLAISTGGTEAIILDLTKDLHLTARRTFQEDGQISCINVPELAPNMCIAGFWKTASIILMDSRTLNTVTKVGLSGDEVSVPRSILLAPILTDQPPTLFIAMANGEVITFALDIEKVELSARKAIILGTQQANFKALPRKDGLFNVFATCEHPSLIYGSEGRIIYSAITAEKATSVCSFDCEQYPGAVAIVTPEDIRIALIDTERTTHVQTLPVGQTVRRIAYSPKLKTFGIGTIQRSLNGMQEVVQSHFKLADEVLFKTLDTFPLNEEELVESVTRAEIVEDSGEQLERFIVGTAYLEDDHGDSIRGRILVFAVTQERSLKLITELQVKGACRALGSINGTIVAALSKTVVVFALRDAHLQKLATYRTSTAPIDLAIHQPTAQICVADLMKSISIVTYSAPSDTFPEHTLTETARHYQTIWATACAHIDTETWLEADAEGNLLVLRQNTTGVTADDRRRLEVTSEIRLGEMVNRLRPVAVDASPGAPVVPKAFMATVEGGVYLFAQIAPLWLDLLMRLQTALAPLVVSLGHIPFNTYRAFRNQVREAEEPYRFVDGELIESFLEMDAQTQEAVVKELGEMGEQKGGVEGIKALVEGLKRLH